MNKSKNKRLRHWLSLAFIALFLVGCVQIDRATGQPTGEGWVYKYIGLPAANLMDFIANLFGGSYGMAIIIITLITRVFMIPTQIKQTKDQAINQIRQKFAQPEIDQIRAELEATNDPQEQQALNAEMMSVHKKYDMNMLSGLAGCLPLLIQLPILSAVYTAIRTSEQIQQDTFLGVHLGSQSLLMVVLVVAFAFVQGWLIQQNTKNTVAADNPTATQTQNTMLLMNPLLMGWISWSSAAGLGLYLLTSSAFAIILQLYLNYVVRPKAEAGLSEQEEYYANLPKRKPKQTVKPEVTQQDRQRLVPTKSPQTNNRRRNEGIQRKR